MDITFTRIPEEKLKLLPENILSLQFGRTFTDYMFIMYYTEEKGWHNAQIKPYEPLILDPSANVLHYSQTVFEGQKAYCSCNGKILLFRPYENARRMNKSLARLCMPEIPEDEFVQAEAALLKTEKRWVPGEKGASVYIRSSVIATEPVLGVKASSEYLFFIILSPTGPYFKEGFNPVSLYVSENYVRAAFGGTGEAKCGGNYAGSLLAAKEAQRKGYSQVLWLDAKERKYIEECGVMNIFFVRNNTLITPQLSGSILRGITRKSVIEMAEDLNIFVSEQPIPVTEAMKEIESGTITEVFAVGTAAVVTPVGRICYQGTDYIVKESPGPWSRKIFDHLTGIQYGHIEDSRGWIYTVSE